MRENTDSRCTTTATVRGTRLRISGLSCFLLPTLCSRQREVGAAPHRGNANRPISIQGKANATGKQKTSAAQANNSRKGQRRRQTEGERRAGNQLKKRPPRIGAQKNKHRASRQFK